MKAAVMLALAGALCLEAPAAPPVLDVPPRPVPAELWAEGLTGGDVDRISAAIARRRRRAAARAGRAS